MSSYGLNLNATPPEDKQETNKAKASLNPLVLHVGRKLRFNDLSPNGERRQKNTANQSHLLKILVYTPHFSLMSQSKYNN